MHRRFTKDVVAGTLLLLSAAIVMVAHGQTPTSITRPRYDIQLKIDFDGLTYSGSERVTWVNRNTQPTSVIYFHLYSNLRPELQPSVNPYTSPPVDLGEPAIQITEVRAADGAPVPYSIDEQGTVLRINFREQVPAGKSIEFMIGFKGTVPEVDADETGLTSHVVQQVSAALRNEKEVRRPRNINFRCKGVMLLGTFHPVLAVQDGDQWIRKLEPSVGDVVFNEVADYQVRIETAPDVMVFTSGGVERSSADGVTVFAAEGLRDFAVVAGRTLRAEQKQVGATTIRSVFIPEHATVGRRVLTVAEEAVKLFTDKFGPLPINTITITEAPLVAGLGSTEFSGLEVIAAAYYIDLDSPAVRTLPEIIREQSHAVE